MAVKNFSQYNYKMYFKRLGILLVDIPKCACSPRKLVLLKNEYDLPWQVGFETFRVYHSLSKR